LEGEAEIAGRAPYPRVAGLPTATQAAAAVRGLRRGSGGETLTGAGGTRTEGSHWSAGPTYVVSPVAVFCTSPAARSVPAIGRIRTVKPPGTLAGIG